jgi:hypothetical protein
MDGNGTIVRNELNYRGWRCVEVIRMGGPIDPELYVGCLPGWVDELVRVRARHEQALNIFRLFVIWPQRGMIRLVKWQAQETGREAGVLWYIDTKCGETVRTAAVTAATEYWVETGSWPERALIRSLPKGAGDWIEVADHPAGGLRLAVLAWAPKGFILVL